MTRYVAFLRGVNPKNAKMGDLRECFESAGFAEVKTVLASGNVVFDAPRKADSTLARDIEAAMAKRLERTFSTIVRPVKRLNDILESDPYSGFRVPKNAKKVVTFLQKPHRARLALPIETDGVQILTMDGREAFTAYVPHPRGPVFMRLIEKTFGTDVTTRTWDTVKKCAVA